MPIEEQRHHRPSAVSAVLDAGAEIKAHGGNPLAALAEALKSYDRSEFFLAALKAERERQRRTRTGYGAGGEGVR